MAAEFNTMPAAAVRLTDKSLIGDLFDNLQDFFTFNKTVEFRQVNYNDRFIEGSFNIYIYWINKEKRLEFGIARNWKEKTVDWYRFGTAEDWLTFKRGFAAQFAHDNS
jgi:hypothetical protein